MNSEHRNEGEGRSRSAPIVEIKPPGIEAALAAQEPVRDIASEALGSAIQLLACKPAPLTEDVDYTLPDRGVCITAKNVWGEVSIEIAHEDTGPLGYENKLDLSGVPVFLLTDSDQRKGSVVHCAFFDGPTVKFDGIGPAYQPQLSPHFGIHLLDNGMGSREISGTSTDEVVDFQVSASGPDSVSVSFQMHPQRFHATIPGTITVEERSIIFFVFVDAKGEKIDLSGGADPERLDSQGSVSLKRSANGRLEGKCEKTFCNLPPDARLVFMVSPL
ncbi:MAG: hypothetical protein J0M12_07930 [Deltaproteobacteria bacterium]|nr:hypothetical protein [Deltaproteobacteria bacterium]